MNGNAASALPLECFELSELGAEYALVTEADQLVFLDGFENPRPTLEAYFVLALHLAGIELSLEADGRFPDAMLLVNPAQGCWAQLLVIVQALEDPAALHEGERRPTV